MATDDSNRFFLASGNGVTTTPLQSNALINKNGYLVFSRTMAYQLNYEKEPRPTLDFVKKTIGWLSAGDNYRQCLGSWDFENFWVAKGTVRFRLSQKRRQRHLGRQLHRPVQKARWLTDTWSSPTLLPTEW